MVVLAPLADVSRLPVDPAVVTLEIVCPVLVGTPNELVCAVFAAVLLVIDVKRVVPRVVRRLEILRPGKSKSVSNACTLKKLLKACLWLKKPWKVVECDGKNSKLNQLFGNTP